MEILGKILGSAARVKIMRLFLQNRGKRFSNKDIVKRSQVSPDVTRKELNLLDSVGFIKRRGGLSLYNHSFKYASEFEDLLMRSDSLKREMIVSNMKKSGRLKLLIVSGIFIKNDDSRVDLLVVGDNLKRGMIENAIRKLEAELGVELSYALFNTKEYIYRLNMRDKLIRDILDYPHEVLLQGKELVELSTQAPKLS